MEWSPPISCATVRRSSSHRRGSGVSALCIFRQPATLPRQTPYLVAMTDNLATTCSVLPPVSPRTKAALWDYFVSDLW